jgi:hypothetical protein
LPDGLAIGRDGLVLLYDAKAYADGYSVSPDDIKRFASYVTDFHRKYERYIGRIHAFVLSTGKFQDSKQSLQGRSDQLYAKCKTKLSCIESGELGKSVSLMRGNLTWRDSIDWHAVFSNLIVTHKILEKQLRSINRDGLKKD